MATLAADQKIRIRLKAYDHHCWIDRSRRSWRRCAAPARAVRPVLLPTSSTGGRCCGARTSTRRLASSSRSDAQEAPRHRRPHTTNRRFVMKLDLPAGVDVENQALSGPMTTAHLQRSIGGASTAPSNPPQDSAGEARARSGELPRIWPVLIGREMQELERQDTSAKNRIAAGSRWRVRKDSLVGRWG